MSPDPGSRRLPPAWANFLAKQPETGRDFHTGDVILRSGKLYRDVVFIGRAFIGEVKGYETPPFTPEEIVEIQLTDIRWKRR